MKKLLSLVLSMALMCTLIAGCGPKESENSGGEVLDASETTFGLTPLSERTTLVVRNVQTGNGTLQTLYGIRNRTGFQHGVVDSLNGTGRIDFFLCTEADDYHFVNELCIVAHLDTEFTFVAHFYFLRFIADIGNDNYGIAAWHRQ